MHKPALSDAPLIEPVRDRWSPRAFADRAIDDEAMSVLLEAARWAPSCRNEQPWRFVYAHQGEPGYAALEGLLDSFNSSWAVGAPVLMLTIAKKAFDHNDAPNNHAWHDVGLAMGGLLAQATAMGIAAHQMAGFDWKGANERLGIPEAFSPVAMVAFGYAGTPEQLPDGLAEMERGARSRLPLGDVAFRGGWPTE